jgi:hypothetical protein
MADLWKGIGQLAEPMAPPTVPPTLTGAAQVGVQRRTVLRMLAYAASFLLVFGAGWTAHRLAGSDTPDPASGATGQAWLILLREPSGAPLVETGSAAERAMVAEYGAWAGELARQGKLVSAEKLADPVTWLPGPGAPEATSVTGFFLVRAATAAEAERIARASPHIQHGGTIELRPIDPT